MNRRCQWIEDFARACSKNLSPKAKGIYCTKHAKMYRGLADQTRERVEEARRVLEGWRKSGGRG